MNIGHDCFIDDRWIPDSEPTGLIDGNGVEIKTRDKVTLAGCRTSTAIVGKTDRGFQLFIGSENGSCGWILDEKVVKEHHIEVIMN
ncbi:hypothetical protein H7E67_01260 [Clostridium gasigenes]|uniref:hypothetical protein n=1 Tax=Clostridium gasigenes TaxID=94869 RepID=UPI0016242517|nr:hypothetical protein [Clostridium gasigenes]MBB6622047.1 hypothetical protein [Clostridium gasigenes]